VNSEELANAGINRAAKERKNQSKEPELADLRSDLARALGDFIQQNFAHIYGPLIGPISEGAIEKFLKDFEENSTKAKTELTFVLQELLDRIISSK
jgi:hypothetical protein